MLTVFDKNRESSELIAILQVYEGNSLEPQDIHVLHTIIYLTDPLEISVTITNNYKDDIHILEQG